MTDWKKIYLWMVAAVLLIAGWPPLPSSFLLFLGFVPLLIIHSRLQGSKKKHLKFWGWTYLLMLAFNTGCTWWVWNADPVGSLFMLFANALIMSLPFLLMSFTNSVLPKTGYLSLLIYYPAMENFHFNWSGSWPWMTLGKGLAAYPWFIQWYEFTGELGGTLLILWMNLWIFKIIIRADYKGVWKPIIIILLMTAVSYFLAMLAPKGIPIVKGQKIPVVECVVSQPNIDPYEEKFGDGEKAMSPEKQLAIAIDVTKPFITKETELLVMPETALVGWNQESSLNQSSLFKPVLAMTDSMGIVVLAGAETFNNFAKKADASNVARYDSFFRDWFDVYNTALLIRQNKISDIYHKSKLVPGVESMPFDFLRQLSIDLGGTSGSLAISKEPINFVVNDQLTIAPLICYESVFGDYVSEFVRKGATGLAVITNDGWWGNTPGYKQHLLFGAIRSIETRKEMVRSANTGVSAKIDVCGNISHATKYNERTAFRCTLVPNKVITFYVKYGNLIGIFSCWGASLLFLFSVIKWISGMAGMKKKVN